ncbi:unnamed protein product [Meloidogyne enterolobii]|uniref:Uncharacterized protein n=2 Tax=Meloidogyne TaxID=189290 RepID=A0ACB0Z652_MELEN
MTGMDLRSILGPVADHLVQTTTPFSYTRPIMKNKFVDYGILSLDNFLNGRFRSMQRIPYLLEKEKMLKLRNNETLNTQTHEKEHEEEQIEGSGEEDKEEEEKQIENKNNTLKELNSSIKGIPKTKPFIPKIPLLNFNNNEKDELINTKINKNKEENKINEIMENNDNNNLINMEEYQYGAKPNMQQGILNTLLDFFGVKYLQGSELDKVLTDWIMENTPKYISKSDKRAGINTSSYDVLRGLLSQPVLPLCSSPPQLIEHFNLDAFMGQWFEVFSVSKNSDLKFEAKISKLLKKCKIRVYDHGGKGGSDLEVNYKVIKKLSGNKFDEKWLSKILTSEKRKSKINLLRLEVGDQTDKIVQSKILREHSICHLLLTVSGLSKKKLETFVKKMQKSYGYSLYAAYRMGDQPTSINYEESATKDSLDALDEDAVNLLETPKEKKASLKTKREALVKDRRSAGVYTMSFISKNCQKEYGVKWIDQ